MTKKTINAVVQHNDKPEHAKKVIETIQKSGITCEQIAERTGLTVRTVFRSKVDGFTKYPTQFILESMAGMR